MCVCVSECVFDLILSPGSASACTCGGGWGTRAKVDSPGASRHLKKRQTKEILKINTNERTEVENVKKFFTRLE